MKLKMLILAVAMMLIILPKGVFAAAKTADDAKQLVVNWLKLEQRPLGVTMGQHAKAVQTFRDDKGEPMYHVVYLDPSGFVIVPADDLVEPIIAFVSQGHFDPSMDNPLGALVGGDVPARVSHARALRVPPSGHLLRARDKWHALQLGLNGDTNSAPTSPLSTVSDLRIAPFLQTLWNQGTANNGMACYNYYTPPYAAGAPSNWPCGKDPPRLTSRGRKAHGPPVCAGNRSACKKAHKVATRHETGRRVLMGAVTLS